MTYFDDNEAIFEEIHSLISYRWFYFNISQVITDVAQEDRLGRSGAINVWNIFSLYTVELQWLEHLWNHKNKFDTWVVRADEC